MVTGLRSGLLRMMVLPTSTNLVVVHSLVLMLTSLIISRAYGISKAITFMTKEQLVF